MPRCNRIFLLLFLFPLLCGCARTAAATPEDILDKTVFVGDSTTAHMKNRSALRKDQVWATKERYLNLDAHVTGAKIEVNGEEMTIKEAVAACRPAYLVITLGVDHGVYYYRDRPETFRACYEALLDDIKTASPDTAVILQSVFPVGRQSMVITNEMIRRANDVIKKIAAARGLYYLDAHVVLCDDEGFLRAEYVYSEDGIHLTAAAYAAILQNYEAHAAEIGEMQK